MIYIALLKAVNVGGKNILKMSELKQVLHDISLDNVKTYIQSGNIIFKSEKESEILKTILQEVIHEKFNISTEVVIRNLEEMKYIMDNIPFDENEIKEAESFSDKVVSYICLFGNKINIDIESYKKIKQLGGDKYYICDKEIYILLKDSISNSKSINELQKLGNTSTIRNTRTLKKLLEIAISYS